MIPALQRARIEYERQFLGRKFEDLLGKALCDGAHLVVFPELFVLAVPASLQRGRWVMDDQGPSAWYVVLAATGGASNDWDFQTSASMLAGFLRVAPARLPSVVWRRRGGPERVYSWDRLARWAARKAPHGIR